MVSLKLIGLFLAITMVTSNKVQLVCEDKASFCTQANKEKVCELSDLSKLICRKTCDHCKCVNAETELCAQDDVCHSIEGRLLCPKKCNACDFRIVDDDKKPEDPKDPKEPELIKEPKEPKDGEKSKDGEKDKAEPEPETNGDNDDGKPTEAKVDQECLKYHNKFRTNHEDTPPMEWDEEMAKGAEEYAKKLAETGEFKHADAKDRNDAGENLSFRGGKFESSPCSFAVGHWYNEITDFDFNSKTGRGTGHFTQVVWKESTKLGCGVGTKGSSDYVVCRYLPAGNMMGDEKKSIGDLKKGVTMDDIKSQVKEAGVKSFKRRNHVSKLFKKEVL